MWTSYAAILSRHVDPLSVVFIVTMSRMDIIVNMVNLIIN